MLVPFSYTHLTLPNKVGEMSVGGVFLTCLQGKLGAVQRVLRQCLGGREAGLDTVLRLDWEVTLGFQRELPVSRLRPVADAVVEGFVLGLQRPNGRRLVLW